jgi:hypothetical protein
MWDAMGLVLLFLPWAFLAFAFAGSSWARRRGAGSETRVARLAIAGLAAVEAAAVAATLIDRHGRQFSEGLARLWPFRIYIVTGALLLVALLLSTYELVRRAPADRTRGVMNFGVCSALLPFWLVFSALVYSG